VVRNRRRYGFVGSGGHTLRVSGHGSGAIRRFGIANASATNFRTMRRRQETGKVATRNLVNWALVQIPAGEGHFIGGRHLRLGERADAADENSGLSRRRVPTECPLPASTGYPMVTLAHKSPAISLAVEPETACYTVQNGISRPVGRSRSERGPDCEAEGRRRLAAKRLGGFRAVLRVL
jgi:hypothetical protein